MRRKSEIRQSVAVSVLLAAVLFAVPLMLASPAGQQLFSSETQPVETEPFVPGELDSATVLKVLDGDTVREMTMGEYLTGVLRAEMPASFEEEALKAQAVAARTYTLYKMITGGNHGDTADICTDSTCCQAYLSEEQALENWGDNAGAYQAKIRTAVKETDRAAGEVWLSDLPYLQPVTSPEQGDAIPNYYSRADFTAQEFREKVLSSYPEADLSGTPDTWLTDAVTDSAGSVETVSIGGVTLKGATVRSLLGLRSACFEWETSADGITFYVTGFGHGVGMSQYGANQMAADGADYREILTHYYTGVTVEPYHWAGG